jgi:hypothetical protein
MTIYFAAPAQHFTDHCTYFITCENANTQSAAITELTGGELIDIHACIDHASL